MNISRLRLLTFDVTGTLIKFKHSPAKQYGEIGAMYGITCDTDLLTKSFKVNFRKMTKNHPNFGLNSGIGWERWWKELVTDAFKDSADNIDNKKMEEISAYLIQAYTNASYWQHCHGALDILSYLTHRKIPLGVVSNYDPRLENTLRNNKIRHYFRFVITSYEAGIEKPDSRIFKEAMQISELKDLKPEECLHIGDTVAKDYQGAINAGWQGAIISNENLEDLQKKHDFLNIEHVFPSLYDFQKHLISKSNEKLIVHNKSRC